MKINSELFELISSSFGFSGKTVRIINNRRTSDGNYNISDISHTKDGKNILASYCDQNRNDPEAFEIFEEVNKFEKKYGDGTSLLTMLLTYLTYTNKINQLSDKEIDRDIDSIIGAIKSTEVEFNKDESDLILKNWLMTVCKNDKIWNSLFNFYKENPRANIKSIRRTETFSKDELIFKPRSGYTVSSRVHSTYLNPIYSKFTDYRCAVTKLRLDSDLYKAFEDQAYQADSRLIVLCSQISDEAEKLINESVSQRIVAIRYNPDQIDEIYKDLTFMFKKDPDENGIVTGNVKEIKISEDSITLYGFERSMDELIEYCNELTKEFESTDDNDKELMDIRIANIISGNTFDILINTLTLKRYKMLHGMVEDVIKSKKYLSKGLIIGGMSYINETDEFYSGQIIKITKEIYRRLHKGRELIVNNYNIKTLLKENKDTNICVPLDLKENIIQIFEIVRSYLKELSNTHEKSIITNSKWYGV